MASTGVKHTAMAGLTPDGVAALVMERKDVKPLLQVIDIKAVAPGAAAKRYRCARPRRRCCGAREAMALALTEGVGARACAQGCALGRQLLCSGPAHDAAEPCACALARGAGRRGARVTGDRTGARGRQRLDSGEIQVNCIIRVNEYTPNMVQGKRLVIVMELDVIPGPVLPKVRWRRTVAVAVGRCGVLSRARVVLRTHRSARP